MNRNRVNSDDKIKVLEKSLQERNTSEDTSLISPAAEAAVRKSIVREYEKTLAAERDRNARATDSVQTEYSGRLHDTIIDGQAKENNIQQQNAADRHQDRQQLLDHIQDTESLKQMTLRNQELTTPASRTA